MRWRSVTPREAALTILHAWFGPAEAPTRSALSLTAFQREAVTRIAPVLQTRRGALLADAVGLGKTYIALAVIEDALGAGQNVVVVVPAALRRHWQQHLRKLPQHLRDGPRLVTHTALSFGRLPAAKAELVVVDEAHAFRNHRTRRYEALITLTQDAHVLLLSATPINNTLADLYHLIRLFASDHAFRDLGVADLWHTFRRADLDPLSRKEMDRVIEAVVVRRTRSHVDANHGRLRFARRAPPKSLRYDLVAAYGPAWPDTYRTVERLHFACATAAANGAGAELMRLQLLKRLESSVTAFALSLRRLAQLNGLLLDALQQGCWIEPAALRSLIHDGEVGTQLPLQALLTAEMPRELDVPALRSLLQADRDLIQRCLAGLRPPLASADPKLEVLHALLRELGPGVLVFTQYRDTAVHLWKQLQRRVRVGLVHGTDARLGAQRVARSTVIECFAPVANGARAPAQRARVDVLIATDVLSEGLNLQDAHTVVSYDLPWNPVTLMQRMGRVDRLGSPHDCVRLYNFLPDRGLDELLGLLERVERKLHIIQRTVGADGAVLDLPDCGVVRAAINTAQPSAAGENAFAAHEEIEALRELWRRNAHFTPPAHAVTAVMPGQSAGWLFALRDGARTRLLVVDATGGVREDYLVAGRLLGGALLQQTDKDLTATQPPWTVVLEWIQAERSSSGLLASHRKPSPESQAAHLLLKALDHTQTDRPTMRRAGRLLRRLSAALDAGTASRLRLSLNELSAEAPLRHLVTLFETALGQSASNKYQQSAIRPVAAVQIVASEPSRGAR